MKNIVAAVCYCILCSTEIRAAADKTTRQAGPHDPLRKNCSAQEEQEFRQVAVKPDLQYSSCFPVQARSDY